MMMKAKWTYGEEPDVAYCCWKWERKEIVAGMPLLMKIEEEVRSRELLKRSLSLLKSR